MSSSARRVFRKIVPKKIRKALGGGKNDALYVKVGKFNFKNPLNSNSPLQNITHPAVNPLFSIVTPAYNCEEYLEDYFNSLYRQSFDFNLVEIIIVDDCSTDGTNAILKEWANRYGNISLYSTPVNSGQGAARNIGIERARGEYITFIDPDDFLEAHYFERVYNLICTHPTLKIIETHPILYWEAADKYGDSHATAFKFKSGVQFSLPLDDSSPIQMSTAYAVIHREEIGDIRFDDRIKPTFEDAHFITRYQLGLSEGLVAVLPRAFYLYRKRASENSSVDASQYDPRQYDDVLRYGCLDLVHRSIEKYGYVPKMVQTRLFYQLIWIYRTFVNADDKAQYRMRSTDETAHILDEICRYIDSDTAAEFSTRFPYEMRRGWLDYYGKDSSTLDRVVYAKRVDEDKHLIRFFAFDDVEYYLDGVIVEPVGKKKVCQNFLGKPFIQYDVVEVPYDSDEQVISILDCQGRQYKVTLIHNRQLANPCIKRIASLLNEKNVEKPVDSTWVLMDRFDRADDNAEYLYRWIASNHPEQKIAYVLNRDAEDWDRLEKDGFNLIPHDTKEWEDALRKCSAIVSSQFDAPTFNPFNNRYFSGAKKIVTLQHGVISNDLSPLVNRIPFNFFVTSTVKERKSIVDNDSPYAVMPRDIVRTGLPRWDSFDEARDCSKSILLIVPTWRRYLFKGNSYALVVDEMLGEQFAASEYAQCWQELLNDPRLVAFADRMGLNLVFKPHPNILKFVKAGYFNINQNIKVDTDSSYTSLSSRTSICLTDYSSLPYDVAYAGGLSVYFQFDEDEFFANHTFERGYFDYRRDGFGPVAKTSDDVFSALELLFDPSESASYRKRVDDAFPVRDAKNCKRVYDAICNLFSEDK